MKTLKILLAAAALLPVLASAQTVNHRQHEQYTRIRHGVHSGALTHREAARLRAREVALRVRERRDRFFHHGRLTSAERHHLNHAENRLSHDIHRQKHDAQHH